MINLLQFFIDNVDGYYNKFYTFVVSNKDEFPVFDKKEIIDEFREICKPPDENFENNNLYFILLCFWLYKNGFVIKEFPDLLSRPDTLYHFAYKDIREYIMKRDNSRSPVRWKDRRELCDNMKITSSNKFQQIPSAIKEKIRLISTRDADFDNMEIDEKLFILNALIEHLLKKEGKYINLEYDRIFFGYFTQTQIVEYRKKTHIFRHGSEDAIALRNQLGEAEKLFLSDLGIFIAIHIYKYLAKK
ncbi:MAG: hypothetical protein LBD36_00165 [Holosporales bacterium]|jgi:hypothetical protein|nr:hypothetical protein [Holosporales bacterium]